MQTQNQNTKRGNARRVKLIAALTVPTALLLVQMSAFVGAQDKTPDAPPKPATAAQRYKNIKALKDLPATQLMQVMHEYNTALNVQCSFCHVVNAQHNAWDKDDVPMKNVTRQMIGIVNDLNAHQKSLNGRATCYMCHHGHPEPVTTAPEKAPDAKPDAK